MTRSDYLCEDITFTWRNIRFRARHYRNHRGNIGWSKIVLTVLTPNAPPDPLTHDGYVGTTLDEDAITASGGLQIYFEEWLNRQAETVAYAKAIADWKQLRLL